VIDSLSYWNTGNRQYNWSLTTSEVQLPGEILQGKRYPADYEIQFGDSIVYITPTLYGMPELKMNFRLFNLTDSIEVPFIYVSTETDWDSINNLKPKDILETFWQLPDSTYQYTWTMAFTSVQSDPEDTLYQFHNGDLLHIETTKPFSRKDVFEFSTDKPVVIDSVAENSMADIQVVPNPYVVANIMEAPLPPSITSGRGERRVEFRKLPKDAKVHIFTARGSHVITLNQNGNIHNGTIAWNLKTNENLDVAFGVYFYIVESEMGRKSGKLAIIK
jgi:hypothetical protein